MIIEIFGPTGSGKTTFAHALARRLRGDGYHAKVVLSYQPSTRGGRFDFGIFLFISRIMAAIFSTSKILLSPRGRMNLSTSLSMIRMLPPKKRIWRARLWQYLLKLSRCWDQAKQSRDVEIFDQGYVQAIASLAMSNGTADNVALAKALSLAPVADITLRVVVPQAIVETRLLQRMEHEPPAERIFEPDFDTSMRAFGMFQTINDILMQSNRKNSNRNAQQPIIVREHSVSRAGDNYEDLADRRWTSGQTRPNAAMKGSTLTQAILKIAAVREVPPDSPRPLLLQRT
ncbi:hypothetical protein NKH36_07135 [Mesorhizobium sp. M1312]|uniref:hypothetical protein n=1 Tax=unclassified Mesorhizobium TaxID=325217 RepID=UPI003339B747